MRNQVLITLDSLRYDTFHAANLPFLKGNTDYACGWTQGTYTLPAHDAFFAGRLAHNFAGEFDTCARYGRKLGGVPFWRLSQPESPGPGNIVLNGSTIIDGFNRLGYTTIGTGAVGWLNTNQPAYLSALDDFTRYHFFGEYTYAVQQVKFVRETIDLVGHPFFVFVNFGETHHPYILRPGDKPTLWGDKKCFGAQVCAVEYLDNHVKNLLDGMTNTDVFICGDHGDCMGEDGLWGHGFYHEKVMQVPMIKMTL